MNDPHADRTDPSTPPVGVTDQEVQAFLDRILNGDGRRHYLALRRPQDAEGESR
jgi:hypothetical protein